MIDKMIFMRKETIEKVFKNKINKKVHLPVCFKHILDNIKGQFCLNSNSTVDITPLDFYVLLDKTYEIKFNTIGKTKFTI